MPLLSSPHPHISKVTPNLIPIPFLLHSTSILKEPEHLGSHYDNEVSGTWGIKGVAGLVAEESSEALVKPAWLVGRGAFIYSLLMQC